MMHFRSVRGRITLVATALVALTLTLASFAIIELVENDLVASAERALDDALAEQAEQAGFEPEEEFRFYPAVIDGQEIGLSLFSIQDEGVAFGDLYIGDEIVAEIVFDLESEEVLEVNDPATGTVVEDPRVIEAVEELSFAALDADGEDGGPLLVGARSLNELNETSQAVREALLVTVPALVLAFAVLTWWLAGRALRPVHRITEQVESITTSRLDQRVPESAVDDEIGRLASVMNDMLGRLEAGDERQRRFSADASHELRSPLSSVRMAAEMIESQPTHARNQRLADDIIVESERMDVLIGDLLRLSRLEEPEPRPAKSVDLGELIADRLGPTTSVELEAPSGHLVAASADELWSVARNLVENATRAAAERVVVSVSSVDAATLLTVEDDGDGVPVEQRAKIFDRFHRLDEARTRDAGGSGLGLALARGIVERHHGSLTVDQSPGLGGARFVARFPDSDRPDR